MTGPLLIDNKTLASNDHLWMKKPFVNPPPTNIHLSANTVTDVAVLGTPIGQLTVVDLGDSAWTFAIDNPKFKLSTTGPAASSQLQRSGNGTLTVGVSETVRITVTDSNGGTFQKTFSITVINAIPIDVHLDNNAIDTNASLGTVVGTLTVIDPDDNAWLFAIDNPKFQLSDPGPANSSILQRSNVGQLTLGVSETVNITVTDSVGNIFSKTLMIIVGGQINITSVVVRNDNNFNASPTNTPLNFGHVLGLGTVPSYNTLRATWTSTGSDPISVPLQIDGESTWPDNSLRFANFKTILPSLPANGTGSLLLVTLPGSKTSTLPGGKTLADVRSDFITNHIFTVQLTNVRKGVGLALEGAGTLTWSANDQFAFTNDLDNGLNGTNLANPRLRLEVLEQGNCCVFFRVWGPFLLSGIDHDHLHCIGYYRAWLDATTGTITKVEFTHRINSGYIAQSNPDQFVYDVTVSYNATNIRTLTGVHHYYRTGVHLCPDTGLYDWTPGLWVTNQSTLNLVFDNQYWETTNVVPPLDLSISASPSTTTPLSYSPTGVGCLEGGLDTAGDHLHLGLLPYEGAMAFKTQHPTWIQASRMIALEIAHSSFHFIDEKTGRIPNTVSQSFPGMEVLHADDRWLSDGLYIGVTIPPANDGLQSPFLNADATGYDSSHWPSPCYYDALRTGDPRMLDEIKQMANEPIWNRNPVGERNPVGPDQVTYHGCCSQTFYGERIEAWAWKHWAQCLAVLPDATPEKAYFEYIMDQNIQYNMATLNSFTPDVASTGMWSFIGGLVTPWMVYYVIYARALTWGILRDDRVYTLLLHHSQFVRQMLGDQLYTNVRRFPGSLYASFIDLTNMKKIDGVISFIGPWDNIGGDSTGAWPPNPELARFEASTGFVYSTRVANIAGFASAHFPNLIGPAVNGDMVQFSKRQQHSDESFSGPPPPSTVPEAVNLFIVDLDLPNSRFRIALTPNGTPLSFPADVADVGMSIRIDPDLHTIIPAMIYGYGFNDTSGNDQYIGQVYGLTNYLMYLGVPNMDVAYNNSKATADALAGVWDPAAHPRWVMSNHR